MLEYPDFRARKTKALLVHALRHNYATRAIESGMHPKILQKLLGHTSIKMTMAHYVHATNDPMNKVVQQFSWAQAC